MKPILRFITRNDIENLRVWKNTNKQAFFYQHDISKEAQEIWYGNYIIRNFYKEDFMYIVEYDNVDVGCIGYRIVRDRIDKVDRIDIYNVMLGNTSFKGKGIIKRAAKQLFDYLKTIYTMTVTVKVLIANGKMVEWYLVNGWSNIHVFDDYVVMKWGGSNEAN